MLFQETILDDLVHHALVEARRVQIGRLFGLQQLRVQRFRRDRVAQPQARRQHFGERAEVDRAVARRCRQRRWRRFVEPQIAIRVVFDDRQAELQRFIDECRAARRRQTTPARVLVVRQQVDETRVAYAGQAFGRRAFVVTFDGVEHRLIRRESLQRAEVGRCFDRHRTAGVDQHLADQIEPLLRAGGDQHLVGVGLDAVRGHLGGDPLAQRRITFTGCVLQGFARRVAQDSGGGLGHRGNWKCVGRRQPTGERNDAGPFGDLEDLADR